VAGDGVEVAGERAGKRSQQDENGGQTGRAATVGV
jgi:hypothetical protein